MNVRVRHEAGTRAAVAQCLAREASLCEGEHFGRAYRRWCETNCPPLKPTDQSGNAPGRRHEADPSSDRF
jgi:hypothetical protein